MPSRKQRRRRQKLQRHEYEYVVETEEGEIPLDQLEEEAGKDGRKRGGASEGVPLDRHGRPVQKPTLQRVLKRAAIFAPILVVFVYLTSGDRLSTVAIALNTLILLAFFIPFSYMVDVLVYRALLRRARRERAEKRSP